MERIVDAVSQECNIKPEMVRFLNFIQPHEFPLPFKQITGSVYDSGDYPAMLQEACRLSGLKAWRDKQKLLLNENRYIGIGIAFAIEPAGVAVANARYSGMTQAHVRITPDGFVESQRPDRNRSGR